MKQKNNIDISIDYLKDSIPLLLRKIAFINSKYINKTITDYKEKYINKTKLWKDSVSKIIVLPFSRVMLANNIDDMVNYTTEITSGCNNSINNSDDYTDSDNRIFDLNHIPRIQSIEFVKLCVPSSELNVISNRHTIINNKYIGNMGSGLAIPICVDVSSTNIFNCTDSLYDIDSMKNNDIKFIKTANSRDLLSVDKINIGYTPFKIPNESIYDKLNLSVNIDYEILLDIFLNEVLIQAKKHYYFNKVEPNTEEDKRANSFEEIPLGFDLFIYMQDNILNDEKQLNIAIDKFIEKYSKSLLLSATSTYIAACDKVNSTVTSIPALLTDDVVEIGEKSYLRAMGVATKDELDWSIKDDIYSIQNFKDVSRLVDLVIRGRYRGIENRGLAESLTVVLEALYKLSIRTMNYDMIPRNNADNTKKIHTHEYLNRTGFTIGHDNYDYLQKVSGELLTLVNAERSVAKLPPVSSTSEIIKLIFIDDKNNLIDHYHYKVEDMIKNLRKLTVLLTRNIIANFELIHTPIDYETTPKIIVTSDEVDKIRGLTLKSELNYLLKITTKAISTVLSRVLSDAAFISGDKVTNHDSDYLDDNVYNYYNIIIGLDHKVLNSGTFKLVEIEDKYASMNRNTGFYSLSAIKSEVVTTSTNTINDNSGFKFGHYGVKNLIDATNNYFINCELLNAYYQGKGFKEYSKYYADASTGDIPDGVKRETFLETALKFNSKDKFINLFDMYRVIIKRDNLIYHGLIDNVCQIALMDLAKKYCSFNGDSSPIPSLKSTDSPDDEVLRNKTFISNNNDYFGLSRVYDDLKYTK